MQQRTVMPSETGDHPGPGPRQDPRPAHDPSLPVVNPRIAFFGHNALDAAVKRRIVGLLRTGATVRAYTMRRGDNQPREWDNVDLGRTYDRVFWQRGINIVRGLAVLLRRRGELLEADLWIARNLDMLVLAYFAKTIAGSKAPLVYECLDIHPLMTRSDPLGRLMRSIERRLLARSERLIVSSPGFMREYFDVHHQAVCRASVIENRLPSSAVVESRPEPGPIKSEDQPIVIGWFGNLHCQRSLNLLHGIAKALPDRIQVVLYGMPSLAVIPDFASRVHDLPNFVFRGQYRYPDDLARIYGELDLIWAGDFYDARFNSRWLLPNRIYEGGYFGVPPIAPSDGETGRWIATRSAGWLVDEPVESTLLELLGSLTHAQIHARRRELLTRSRDFFVSPDSELSTFVDQVLRPAQA